MGGDICAERGITTSRSATPDTVARHVLRLFAATKPYTVKVRTVYYYCNTDNIMLCRPSCCLSFRCSRPTCMFRHVFLHLFPSWRRTNTFVIIRFQTPLSSSGFFLLVQHIGQRTKPFDRGTRFLFCGHSPSVATHYISLGSTHSQHKHTL